MANENNLIPNSERSPSELQAMTSKGGWNSGRARRKKRDMRDKMKMLLEIVPQNCEDFNSASEFGVDMENIDNETVMLISLFNEAKQGAEVKIKKQEFELKKRMFQDKSPDVENEAPQLYRALEEETK